MVQCLSRENHDKNVGLWGSYVRMLLVLYATIRTTDTTIAVKGAATC
jgi:hypothetical protein